VSLLVNGIDWLSDDTGLIELRTKGVTARRIDEMEDSKKLLVKIINYALPLFLIILYGILRYAHSRNVRIKRMEEDYV
jgi:hypothetical protein